MDKTRGGRKAPLSDEMLWEIIHGEPMEKVCGIFGEFVNCFLADYHLGPLAPTHVEKSRACWGEKDGESFTTILIKAKDRDGRPVDVVIQVRPKDFLASYKGMGASFITSHLEADASKPRGVVMVLCGFDTGFDFDENEFVAAKAICLARRDGKEILGMLPIIYIDLPRGEAIYRRRLDEARIGGRLGFDSRGAEVPARRFGERRRAKRAGGSEGAAARGAGSPEGAAGARKPDRSGAAGARKPDCGGGAHAKKPEGGGGAADGKPEGRGGGGGAAAGKTEGGGGGGGGGARA